VEECRANCLLPPFARQGQELAEIASITTPPERAQRAANYLIGAGIKGIINFAPARIAVPKHIHLEYVDFFHYFYAAAFHIRFDESRD
jgi:redox-sensing transcriptional repressor